MARRKPDKAVEGERPITAACSAKMLETYVGMILDLADHGAAPGKTGPGWLNLFETTTLALTKDDRILLVGLPELGDSLKGRLDTAAGGDQGVGITLEELAGMLLALSHRMSEARGREAPKVMQVAAKVASCFNDHRECGVQDSVWAARHRCRWHTFVQPHDLYQRRDLRRFR